MKTQASNYHKSMKMKLIVEYEMTIVLSHTNTVDKIGGDKKQIYKNI